MKTRLILPLVIFSLAAYFYFQFNLIIDFIDLRLMGIIGVCQFLYSVWTWRKFNRQIISPYIFFLFIVYIFTFGQSMLYAINYVSVKRDLLGFYGITIQEIFYAQYLTVIFLSFFHIGALLSIQKTSLLKKKLLINSINSNKDHSDIYVRFGWFLFFISFIPYWYRLFALAFLSLKSGYGAVYEADINPLLAFIGSYYIPSVICLFIGYKNNKLVRNFLVGILLLAITVILATGGRSVAVILLALLLLMRNYTIKKVTKKEVVVILVASFFVLSLLSVVANIRSSSNRNLNDMFTEEVADNAALDAIAEMGGSMNTLIWTSNIVPRNEDFRYGKTYLYSITTLIPNLGFWKIHPAVEHSNVGNWLTDKMSLSHGLGYGTAYSMTAEAYINFGEFGWIAMLFMGVLFGNLLDVNNSKKPLNDTLKLLLALIIFMSTASIARNSFIGFIRSFFLIALPIYLYLNYKLKSSKKTT